MHAANPRTGTPLATDVASPSSAVLHTHSDVHFLHPLLAGVQELHDHIGDNSQPIASVKILKQ